MAEARTRAKRLVGAAASLVLLGLASPSPAATFNYFPAPADVTPGVAGSWQDVSVSASVPVGATGVIVQFVQPAGVDEDYGVRKKGSTDAFYPGAAKATSQGWMMTGLDPNRVFQVFMASTTVRTYLVGYTMGGVTFLTNRVDKSTATTGSYVDVSVAAETGAARAIGAIFHVTNTSGSSVNYAVRKKGSTDNRLFGLRANNVNMVMIGVDGTETAQQQIASTALDLYLVGYVTSGAVFFTNGIDKSTGTSGSYVDVDLTADLGAGVANGAFLEINNDSGNRRDTAVRPNGATYDNYQLMQHQFAVVGLDAGDIFEQKIENTEMDVFVNGYSLASPTSAFRVKSGAYSGTGLARSITGLGFTPDVVIIDSAGGGGADAVIRTSTMAGANSKELDNFAAFTTTKIVSLDADGFSLGTDVDVNQNTITYYWVAFKAAPGCMKVGTYAGAVAAQNIGGVGFSPAYVIVISPNADHPMQKSVLMPTTFSENFAGAGFSNSILDMQTNGFRVGTYASVSGTPVTFHYVAWNAVPGQIAVGSYAGDNADGRNITGVGFAPEYVIVDRSTDVGGATGTSVGNAPVHKTASSGVSTDSATLFNSTVSEADNIQALQADGFQVGTHCRANGNGAPPCNSPAPVTYYWMAFGPHGPSTNYRSIGTAADLVNQGTITVTAGSTNVTKVGGTGWKAANRGRGDRLTVGVNHYQILAVNTDNQITLATPAVAGFVGGAYTIARQFLTFQEWEDCVSRSAVNTCKRPADVQEYFPPASSNLVADDRSEIGIAYKDSVFTPPAQVQFLGATTDANHTLRLTADPGNRHNGVAGAGVVIDGADANRGFRIEDNDYTVEWLEFTRIRGTTDIASVLIRSAGTSQTGVLLQNLLIYDFLDAVNDIKGIGIQGNGGKVATVRNVMIWNGDIVGIEGDAVNDTLTIENCTINGMSNYGIDAFHSQFIVRNTVSLGNPSGDFVRLQADGSLTGSHNTSSDATAAGPPAVFTNAQTAVTAASVLVTPNANLHLRTGANTQVDTGTNLSASFANDIDNQPRGSVAAWDRGADERDVTTAVTLLAFSASPASAAVDLFWSTASELGNLGFHLYRSESPAGPFERITSSLVPGLGSSPTGRSYTYRDTGLVNERTYYYELEDVETTGQTERYGPVSAAPSEGAETPPVAPGPSETSYGDPSPALLREVERGPSHVVLELVTPGFWASPADDGAVSLRIPGFDSTSGPGEPSLPTRRALVEAAAGKKVRMAWVAPSDELRFPGLRPMAQGAPGIEVLDDGTVLGSEEKRREGPDFRGLFPREPALLLGGVFQQETKKAEVLLFPLRWDGSGLTLSRRLRVRLEFSGTEKLEISRGGSQGRRRVERASHSRSGVLAQMTVTDRGLQRVAYDDVFGSEPGRRGRALGESSLHLSRRGQSVAFHLEPAGPFAPGSSLYFVSEGPSQNPYGDAVYELAADTRRKRLRMEVVSVADGASGAVPEYLQEVRLEENHYYQAGLLDAPDLWLWDVVVSPGSRSFPFVVHELATSTSSGRLSVEMQGASDFPDVVDHHVRLKVNGTDLGEKTWDGAVPTVLEIEVPAGVLREGTNLMELEDVGDAGAAYSMVFLNRFSVVYPRRLVASQGKLEGRFESSGSAEIAGLPGGSFVLDTTDVPKWALGATATASGLRLLVQEGRSYLLTATAARPEVRRLHGSALKDTTNRADYLLLGPRAFLDAARPLLDLRESQGLVTKAVSLEDVYEQFGYGEAGPEAIKEFLEYTYHSWAAPSPRYVLLLGDASYDPKDYLGTGVKDWLPSLPSRTSRLWTVSDPAFASVNGEDLLPDLAIGRLPAASVPEAERLVRKVVDFEEGGRSLLGRAVLVADNSDLAGSFEEHADEIASTVLQSRNPRKIYYSREGAQTRARIVEAFDEGASLMSYVGHGATVVWASENIFNGQDVAVLSGQPQQPFLMTMNCLNGFFTFPPLNSLSEELLKAEGKGVVGAFSPTGLSVNDAAHAYHKAVLEEIVSGRHERIGDAILAAQAAYSGTGASLELLSIYHLFGDPALRIR